MTLTFANWATLAGVFISVVVALIAGAVSLRTARIAREPNSVESQAAQALVTDTASRMLTEARESLKLYGERAKDAELHAARLRSEVTVQQDASENLRAALAEAEALLEVANADLENAQARVKRSDDAIRHLEWYIAGGRHLSPGLVIVWAWNALDHEEDPIDLRHISKAVQSKIAGVNESLAKDKADAARTAAATDDPKGMASTGESISEEEQS